MVIIDSSMTRRLHDYIFIMFTLTLTYIYISLIRSTTTCDPHIRPNTLTTVQSHTPRLGSGATAPGLAIESDNNVEAFIISSRSSVQDIELLVNMKATTLMFSRLSPVQDSDSLAGVEDDVYVDEHHFESSESLGFSRRVPSSELD